MSRDDSGFDVPPSAPVMSDRAEAEEAELVAALDLEGVLQVGKRNFARVRLIAG